MELHPLIQKRWSPRAFSDRPVEPDKMNLLFEAIRRAPSCYNEQPWRFIYAQKKEAERFKIFVDLLSERNRTWAQKAPVLMLSVARLNFARNNKSNRYAFHDVGLAMGNLLFQATEFGLYVHQMAGFSVEMAVKRLNIPEGYEPVAMIAIGYPGDPSKLPEDMRKREGRAKNRLERDEFVFRGIWGNRK